METRLKLKDEELDGFEGACGIPKDCPQEVEVEATRLLKLPPSALNQMSSESCGQGAFVLLQFAFYLQKAVNKETSRVRWCEENRDSIILKQVDQVSGYGFEERKAKAIKQNDAAMKLHGMRLAASLRKDRIGFLDEKVREMAHALMALQNTKRNKERS